jgi:hypothetical protein
LIQALTTSRKVEGSSPDEVNYFFFNSPNPLRMRWAGHVARLGEKRNVYRLFVGKPEGRRPLGRPRWSWMDSVEMDLVRDMIECCGLVFLRIVTSVELVCVR